ncbi:MAG: TraB/GumN family protein, partial [Owenweeksia sp.]
MKRIMFWVFAFFLTMPAVQAQKPSLENSLLWKIESPKGNISYLFGTYHLVGSDYLKAKTKVAEAYESSGKVVVEMVADSAALMQLTMLATMQGQSLKALVDSADYYLLEKEIKPLIGYDLAFFDNFKPNMVATMYSVALAQKSAPKDFKYGGQPIDMYFASNGKQKGKSVIALETAREQADILFNSESLKEQAQNLVKMIRDAGETKEVTTRVIKAYQDE